MAKAKAKATKKAVKKPLASAKRVAKPTPTKKPTPPPPVAVPPPVSRRAVQHTKLLRTPMDVLLPYQRKWVQDTARFKICLKSRQIGGSFMSAAELAADCILKPNTQWVVLSTGERQALEWMEKAKLWLKAFEYCVEGYEELRPSTEALLKQAEIRLSNGSSILAVPANPRTIRGYAANLLFDEFAHQEKPDEIWRALAPSITNPLSGEKRIRILSTPNGKENKFYALWAHNKKYSKHLVDIYEAVKQGLPVDLEELKEAIADEETWQQEYLCEFLQSSVVLLPYELIESVEDETCGTLIWTPTATKHYVGVDIGRKHDLTCAWLLEDRGDYLHTVEVRTLRHMQFHQQLEILGELIGRPTVRKAFVDSTGIGANLAEDLARKFGGKVQEYLFTQASKNALCLGMQKAFESKRIRIPKDRAVREDLHSLQRVTNSTGTISFRAPRSEDGHADRSIAAALAIAAAYSNGLEIS